MAQATLRMQEQAATQQQAAMVSREAALEQRLAELERREIAIPRRDRELTTREQELALRDRTLIEREAAVERARLRTSELERSSGLSPQQIGQQRMQLAELEAELGSTRERLRQVSWPSDCHLMPL